MMPRNAPLLALVVTACQLPEPEFVLEEDEGRPSLSESETGAWDETGYEDETGAFGLQNETGESPDLCGPYPEGPYAWSVGKVVPPDTVFPVTYGTAGSPTTISTAQLHENCEEVRSIVFVYGFAA